MAKDTQDEQSYGKETTIREWYTPNSLIVRGTKDMRIVTGKHHICHALQVGFFKSTKATTSYS